MIEWATATNRAIAPMEFPDTLHYLMKDQKITVEHLEETSLIATTWTGLWRDQGTHRGVIGWTDTSADHQYRTAAESRTGDKNTTLHNTYRMILCEMYSCKIEAVNKFLVSLNIPPLTRLEAKM